MKKGRILLSVFLLFVTAAAAMAFDPAPPQPAAKVIAPPRIRPVPPMPPRPPIIITVPRQTDLQAVNISNMDIKITVEANIATTEYDITIYNPNSRVVEGEFDFAMTENQSVTAFALDINGAMRDGVVVEKTKGRQVFEEIVRRGVDPGLIEKSSDNSFKARVYPINARGTRRIKIAVEEKLRIDLNNFIYTLPLSFDKEIASFSLKANVVKQTLAPAVKQNPLDKFKFDAWQDSFTASFEGKNYKLTGALSFAVPVENKQKVFTFEEGQNAYFLAAIPVARAEGKKEKASEITLLWDSSSSAESSKEKYFEFLDAYFGVFKNVKVNLISFNIAATPARAFTVNNGGWGNLKTALETTVYDGGTNLKALEKLSPKGAQALVFTDGLDSFGQSAKLSYGKKTFTINAAGAFNAGFLRATAAAGGGEFINLAERSVESAIPLLTEQVYKLQKITYSSSDFEDVFPANPIAADGNINISGRLKKNRGEITLEFGFTPANTTKQKVVIERGGSYPLAKRMWAQDKINYLSLDAQGNKENIIDISKQYGIVTDLTSLIVLEEIGDYVNNEIEPPAELKAEYDRLLGIQNKNKKDKEKNIIEAALREFNEIKTWWERDFPKDAPAPQEPVKQTAEYGAVTPASTAMEGSSVDMLRHMEWPGASTARMRSGSGGSRLQESASSSSAPSFDDAFSIPEEPAAPARAASVKIEAWSPDTPYLKKLKDTPKNKQYEKYLELKKEYKNAPSFYLDVAAFMQQQEQDEYAVLIVSNISEMKADSVELLRITAQKLLELKKNELALSLFRYIAKLRDDEPQSHRDLAFALEQNGAHQEALENYYKVITTEWDSRFTGIKKVVFSEINSLLSRGKKLDVSAIDSRFISAMPVDVRIVVSWSANDTDIDLHVKDPHGEECYYGRKLTHTGGRLTNDITRGYGPEEFTVKSAVDGKYEAFTNYFSNTRQSLSGPITLYTDFYTFYGTPQQTHRRVVTRLEKISEKPRLGTLEFKEADKKAPPKKTGGADDTGEGEKPVLERGIIDTIKGFFE